MKNIVGLSFSINYLNVGHHWLPSKLQILRTDLAMPHQAYTFPQLRLLKALSETKIQIADQIASKVITEILILILALPPGDPGLITGTKTEVLRYFFNVPSCIKMSCHPGVCRPQEDSTEWLQNRKIFLKPIIVSTHNIPESAIPETQGDSLELRKQSQTTRSIHSINQVIQTKSSMVIFLFVFFSLQIAMFDFSILLQK